jgi:DNA-binding winged helix-turn-helix (wHTH) protein
MRGSIKAFVFCRFCLVPERRALLADGQDLNLSTRAFDLLLTLLERRDRVVWKDELLRLVWAGRVVEDIRADIFQSPF